MKSLHKPKVEKAREKILRFLIITRDKNGAIIMTR
jgi:hypothetical protein